MKKVALICGVLLVVSAFSRIEEVTITTFTHSDIQLEYGGKVIHIDPWSVSDLSKAKPADLILITDDVAHHLDTKAIARVRKAGAPIVIAANGKPQVPDGIVMANGEKRDVAGVSVEATAAYDTKPGEPFHPKGEANGYIVTIGGKRIYVSGDTECIPEMKALTKIDVAFVCMNLPYTMPPSEAAACVAAFKPKVLVPYHYKGSDLGELDAPLASSGVEIKKLDFYARSK